MWNILLWVLLGAFGGWATNERIRGGGMRRSVTPMILGIIGACLGGYLYTMFGDVDGLSGLSLRAMIAAFFGCAAALSLFKQQSLVY
jgi:uncharacterized membrane protein YeaQ/YmgE (transglycosylase-associated protein family)